jgi:periplasmic protein TonB
MSTLQQPEPARTRTVLGEAFVVSLVIEALILAALTGLFKREEIRPKAKPPEPIKVVLAPQAPAPTPAPPAPPPAAAKTARPRPPVPVKPPPREMKQPVAPRRNANSVAPKPQLPKASAPADTPSQPEQAHDKAPETPAPPVDASPQQAQPQPQPEPQSPPQASHSDAKPSALFQARLRDAVQAAVRYPNAARIMRLTGHVRLGFAYQDGTISSPHVVQSSGQRMLDDAALAALNSAAFPAPPPELKGHLLNLEIVVTFAPSS